MSYFTIFVTLASGLLTFSAIWGVGYRFFHRIDELERKIDREARKRGEGQERNEVILLGIEACLDGLHQQGCNGKVTEAIRVLDRYERQRASH